MEGALKDRMVMALTKEHFCLHFLNNDILGGQTCIFFVWEPDFSTVHYIDP